MCVWAGSISPLLILIFTNISELKILAISILILIFLLQWSLAYSHSKMLKKVPKFSPYHYGGPTMSSASSTTFIYNFHFKYYVVSDIKVSNWIVNSVGPILRWWVLTHCLTVSANTIYRFACLHRYWCARCDNDQQQSDSATETHGPRLPVDRMWLQMRPAFLFTFRRTDCRCDTSRHQRYPAALRAAAATHLAMGWRLASTAGKEQRHRGSFGACSATDCAKLESFVSWCKTWILQQWSANTQWSYWWSWRYSFQSNHG